MDTELRLLIYKKDSTNNPGKQLVNEDLRFVVQDTESQKIELDVSDFNISTKDPFFIGLEKLDNHDKNFSFTVKAVRAKDAITLVKIISIPEWLVMESNA